MMTLYISKKNMIIAGTILFTLFGLTIKKDRKEYFDWLSGKS